jgi:hypothetical protein
MSDEVSRSKLWDLARGIVERAAPARAALDDPKDPRLSHHELSLATEALLRWARQLAGDPLPYVDGAPDRGPSFPHTLSTRTVRSPSRWLVECTCGWWCADMPDEASALAAGYQHHARVAGHYGAKQLKISGILTDAEILQAEISTAIADDVRQGLTATEIRDSIIGQVGMMASARTPVMQARYDAAVAREEESLADRIATVADEAFGLFPVQSAHDSLTRIERGITEQRLLIASQERSLSRRATEIRDREQRIAELEENAVRMREYRFALEGVPTDGKGNPLPSSPDTRTTVAEFDPPHDASELCSRRHMPAGSHEPVGSPPRCQLCGVWIRIAAPAAPAKEAWHYSSNEEWFQSDPCDSREEAIAEAMHELSLEPGDRFWIGRAVPITPEDVAEHITDADTIVEQIGSYFYDNLGDQSPECEFTAKPEDAKELEHGIAAVIAAWLTKHDIIKSHRMDKVTDHKMVACPLCVVDGESTRSTCSACAGSGVVLEEPAP